MNWPPIPGSGALQLILVSVLSLSAYGLPQTHSKQVSVASHVAQGRRFEKSKQWPEAEREFRLARQADPNSPEAAIGHAEALAQIGQPFDAELEIQSFLQGHPKVARAHELYAVFSITLSDDFVLGESEMEKCVKLAPDNGMAWKSLGDIYLDHATPEDAITAYKKAVRLLPQNPLVLVALADAYGQQGDDGRAEQTFLRSLKMTGELRDSEQRRRERAGVQYLYGRYLLDRNRAKESLKAIDEALEFNPRSAAALYLRARAYEAMGDYKQAEADALQAFSYGPHDKQGPLQLVGIYRKLHEGEKAEQYATLAQKLVDEQQKNQSLAREVRRLLNVAEAALREGRYSDATGPYEDLLSKVPTFYEAYFGLGMCYSQIGRLSDAETAFRKYLSFEKLSADGHAMLGIILLELKRGEEAVPELGQALLIDPSLDEARKALATEYMREQKPEKAVKVLGAATNTKDPQLIAMLGGILLERGDIAGAQQADARALAIQPTNPDALKLKQEILGRQESAR